MRCQSQITKKTISFLLTLIAATTIQGATPVWVDDDYASGGANDGHTWGIDAFNNIQGGIDAVDGGGTVVVAAGAYAQQLRVDGKSLALEGAGIGQSIIQAVPLVDRLTYDITQWDGTVRTVDACLGVTGSASVDVSGFTVDGLTLGPNNYYGIHLFNSSGSVTDCELVDITHAAGPGSGRIVSLAGSHGVGGSCTVDFSSNLVTSFQKVGILVMGPSAAFTVDDNIVAGGGTTTVAQNGIQIGYGAFGTLTGNTVTLVEYPGTDWAGTGILLMECGDVTVTGGAVFGCEIAIGHSQWNWIYTPPVTPVILVDGVTLDLNQWAVSTHLGEDGASVDLEVTNCNITGTVHSGVNLRGSDVDPWGGGYYTGWVNGSLTANIHDNTIVNGDVGVAETVAIPTGNTVNCLINENDLSGNLNFGVYNDFTNLADATANWWGDPSGPSWTLKAASVAALLPIATPYAPGNQGVPEGVMPLAITSADKGTGVGVTTNVDYSPWWGGNYLGDAHASTWDWYLDNSNASTIQDGVDIALAADVVHVMAGTYEEQVVIAKNLSLVGEDKNVVTLNSPALLTESFVTSAGNLAIIYAHDAEVALSGISINGLGRGNANTRFTGIGYWNASGSITDVNITSVRNTPFSGAQHGVGIYAFATVASTYALDLTNVAVDDIQKAGIVVGGSGMTANVTGCSVTGAGPTSITAQNGIQIGFGAGGSVTNCTVNDVAYIGDTWGASGMLFLQGTVVDVIGGTVSGCQAAIVFDETSGTVDGATVTAFGTEEEEGVSIRDYGATKMSNDRPRPRPASPLIDSYQPIVGQKAAFTMVDLSNLTLVGNGTVGSHGVAAWAIGDLAMVSLTTSDIQGWEIGVLAAEEMSFVSMNASYNRLYNNVYGYHSQTAYMQMGEHNYWGSDRGPVHASNPNGEGDEVTDNVDFEPWCNYDFSVCDLVIGCCEGRVGDANDSGVDEPTISDVAELVDHLFINKPALVCVAEADINQSGGFNPSQEEPGSDITIGDVADLVDYLFITGPELGVLPDCL